MAPSIIGTTGAVWILTGWFWLGFYFGFISTLPQFVLGQFPFHFQSIHLYVFPVSLTLSLISQQGVQEHYTPKANQSFDLVDSCELSELSSASDHLEGLVVKVSALSERGLRFKSWSGHTWLGFDTP